MSDQQAGWHPDPGGAHELRYWDGTAWTDHVSNGGVTSTAPLAASPPPGASPSSAPGGGGAKPSLVIGIVAVVAVALLAAAFVLLRDDDDGDDERARLAAGLSQDDADLDGEDLADLEDLFGAFGDAGAGDMEDLFGAFGGGGLDLDFDGDADDPELLADLYQQIFGISDAQARCLAEAFAELEDLDEDEIGFEAFGLLFEPFERCGIDFEGLSTFGGSGG